MRQQITVYLESENLHWLRRQSKKTGFGMSGLVNSFVSKQRLNDPTFIGNVNRSLENARLADELKNQL